MKHPAIEKERARLRQLVTLNDVKDKLPLAPNGANGETGKSSEIVAQAAIASHNTNSKTALFECSKQGYFIASMPSIKVPVSNTEEGGQE